MLSKIIYVALVCLLVLTAIPYGTFEPWWKATFICGVFAVGIVAIIDSLARGSLRIGPMALLLPLLGLAAFALVQAWTAISADPYQTQFFVLQLLALTVCLALFTRYANTEHRVRVIVYAIVGIAAVSAVFGILRQATQQEQIGFVLPLLQKNQGFAQFLNKNHFAYLMEMAFGLGLGMILAGGIERERVVLYVALLLPIWTGLVFANSRGGILAMLTQVIIAALLVLKPANSVALRVMLVVTLVAGVLLGSLWLGGDRLASNFEATGGELAPNAAGTREGASRNEIWRASLKMFAAHPILGVGLGGYWIGITAYHDASGALTPQEAHNDYLELLVSGGVVGFALGVWFVVGVIRLVRKNLQSDNGFIHAARWGAVLGIAGVAAHSLVDFGLHLMGNAVVFIALLTIATAPIERSD